MTSPEATLEHPSLQEANNQTFITERTDRDGESLLRYDVEISGFPSSHLGHVMLLNLRDQDYPGTAVIEDWPSWTLPVLRWAKKQGAVVGFAHCGFGMAVDSDELPNDDIPKFNSIGTNEAIVDVTHGVVDFLAGAEAMPAMELNAWYHMLNCGYRLAMVGETDYPCIFDERPGVGRTYVRLDQRPVGDDGYGEWIRGLADGRLYFGDGRTHGLDFRVEGAQSGDVLGLAEDASVTVAGTIACLLEPAPDAETERIRSSPGFARPSWHIERARIGSTRSVVVELVQNGLVIERATVIADGTPQDVVWDVPVSESSWFALRVLPSGHTHPVFVEVGGRPVRASRRSAQWCRRAVDVLWEEKSRLLRTEEVEDARLAFDHARLTYDAIADESDATS